MIYPNDLRSFLCEGRLDDHLQVRERIILSELFVIGISDGDSDLVGRVEVG